MKNLFTILLLLFAANSFAVRPVSANKTIFEYIYESGLPNTVRGWYFSETTGNNTTGNGTRAFPYRDHSKSFTPGVGDSILFESGGAYYGPEKNFSNSGIIMTSYGFGSMPVISYSGTATQRNRNMFRFTGSNLKIMGLHFTYPAQSLNDTIEAYVSRGLILENCKNVIVSGCKFSKLGVGIYAPGVTYSQFTFDTCFDMRMVVNDKANTDNDYGRNFIVFDHANFNLVTFCTGLSLVGQCYDYTIDGGFVENYNACSNNTVQFCNIINCNGVMEIGAGQNSSGMGTSFNNIVAYCLIINCQELTYTSSGGGYPVYCDRTRYLNNLIIDTSNAFGGYKFSYLFNWKGSTQIADTVFDIRGNIFVVKGGIDLIEPGKTKIFHSNNRFILGNGSVTNFILAATELNTTIDAEFVNYGKSNYNLKATATSIGTGFNNGYKQDFAGTVISGRYDIGPFQYISPSIPGSDVLHNPVMFDGMLYNLKF